MVINNKGVVIVGFGYIGSVIGAVLADRGFNVLGIESNPRIIAAIRHGQSPFNEPGLPDLIGANLKAKRLRVTADPEEIRDERIFIVTVGTPLSADYEPDLSQIKAAVNSISAYVKDGDLVILKSTVPPHTTENVVAPILMAKGQIMIAFCPERLAEGRAIKELLTIPVVVGGIDEKSTKAAAAFWEEALGVEVIKVQNARTAEMVKLADNLWIDLNIALANDIAKLSDKLGIDALEVIKAANTLPKVDYNVNILLPSVGVGGYCLTKDPWFVYHLGKKFGLDLGTPKVSRNTNDSMPEYSVSLIDGILREKGGTPADRCIAVLGIAFKNNTGDCRFTPTKPVIDILIEHGYKLKICDPWILKHDAESVTDLDILTDIEMAIKDVDCVAFLTGHDEFRRFPVRRIAELVKPGALVFDGRMFFSRDIIQEIESYGLKYKGVGR